MMYPIVWRQIVRQFETHGWEHSMSKLSERLAQISEGAISPCPMGRIIQSLDKETSEALVRALEGRAATRIIHHELQSAGIRIGRDSVASHRNGWCRCGKTTEQIKENGGKKS